MLLRCRNGRIVFIDATSNEGVAICGWEEFSKNGYHNFYDKIVYRPLQYRRNCANQMLLEGFLKARFCSFIRDDRRSLGRSINLVR